MTSSRLIAGVISVLAMGAATAQAAMADPSAVPERTFVVDREVRAVARIGNTVYIGGLFGSVGPRTGPGVALARSAPEAKPASPEIGAGQVAAVVGDGAAGWYVAGRFATVGGRARGNIAHILANGRVDRRFDPRADGDVTALAISGRTLYVGGSFGHIDGAPRPFLAALDLPDGRVSRWRPRPGAIDRHPDELGCAGRGTAPVAVLAVSERTVYVGGSFNSIGARPRHHLAAVNARTGSPTAWDPGTDRAVCALAASGSTIYAGGDFRRADHARRNRGAAWSASSGRLTSWDPNADGDVAALAVSRRRVYAGGGFTAIGHAARDGLAALHAATGKATNWNPQPNADSAVYALTVAGHTVYVGGEFSRIGGQQRQNVAALDAVTGLATTDWKPTPDGPVEALGASRSKVFAGGTFSSVGMELRHNLAALDAATGAVTSWNPGAGGLWGSRVEALVAVGSTLYVGGAFATIAGQQRSGLAALDAGTGAATAWNPHCGGNVLALATSGSTIYAGGDFGSIGGQPHDHLAAIDAATGSVRDWNPEIGRGPYGGSVGALAVAGATVYVGGDFTTADGQPRSNLAAIGASTGAVTAWNPGTEGASRYVRALAAAGSTVYIGGQFDSVGGQPRPNLAAVDTTTGIATDWNPSPDGPIGALAASGSAMFVGGRFTSIAGQPRNNLAAVDATTGASTDWNPDINGTVDALQVSGSTLYAGGLFSSVGPIAQRGFAEFASP